MRIHRQFRIGNITTSEKEIIDISKAWIAISIAFAILLSGSIFSKGFYVMFIVSSITVGIGFLFHELGHKIVAQRFGCFAEFRSFDNMLLLAIVMSFFGFLFAAPGAVMISGNVDIKKNGIISAAGPIVNIVLALIFLILGIIGLAPTISNYGFIINSWLALFNMIPMWNFDGKKILKWNKIVYSIIIGLAIIFVFSKSFLRLI